MKASRGKKISCLLLIGLMFIGLLSFKNIYAEGETGTPVTTGEVTTGETSETTGTGETTASGAKLIIDSDKLAANVKNGLTVDLYKLADIGWDGSVAKYTFNTTDAAIKALLDKIDFNGKSKVDDAELLNKFVNDSAAIVFKNPATYLSNSALSIGTTGNPVSQGLYLAVTHKKGDTELSKYTRSVGGNYVSFAEIEGNEYSFTPNLVFMLDKDLTINLKFSVKTSLVIEKTLSSYAGSPVIFVYKVEVKEENATAYHDHDYVSITFREGGKLRSDVIKGIPENASVRVTEVYTGASYTLSAGDAGTKTIKVSVSSENKVSFKNENENDEKKGYGAKNTFEYTSKGWEFKSKDVGDLKAEETSDEKES